MAKCSYPGCRKGRYRTLELRREKKDGSESTKVSDVNFCKQHYNLFQKNAQDQPDNVMVDQPNKEQRL